MRRLAALLTIVFCVMLIGCSAEEKALQPALDFRTSLLAAGGFTCSADLSADYGETVFDFSGNCSYDGASGTITVTQPDTIAGITAKSNGDGASLTFDDVTLALETLGDGRVAPLAAAWLFGSAWSGDYISAGGFDDDLYRVTILKGYDEDELQFDTWLDNGVPVRGEIALGGRRVLTAVFHDFVLLQRENQQ